MRTVHGGGAVGQALVESSAAKIFFTGSVEVGRRRGGGVRRADEGVGARAGRQGPDDRAAPTPTSRTPIRGALWGGFANAGQTCSGIERVYVVREVAERLHEGLVDGAREAAGRRPDRTGTPRSARWSRREQLELVRELVDDAVAERRGAALRRPRGEEPFFAPAVLTGVTHDMRIMREEIFGPVVPIVTVESEDEAIDLANDSEFGLGASVWTQDRAKGERIARRLAGRHGLDQRPHVHPRRVLVRLGRRQGVRPRPLALEVRPLRVREREARDLGAVAARATSGGTPTTARSARPWTRRPSCSTAATRQAGRAAARAASELACRADAAP